MGRAGVEPALLHQELGPKPSASAYSATCPRTYEPTTCKRLGFPGTPTLKENIGLSKEGGNTFFRRWNRYLFTIFRCPLSIRIGLEGF